MRIVVLLWLVGIWQTASLLHGSTFVTAAFTLGAAALGLWAVSATPRILDELGEPPGRVLELGFAGIHAALLRLVGFEVVVVEPDPAFRNRARERAGDVLAEPPPTPFDAVVASAGSDLTGITARTVVLVGQDGSVWSSA